MGVKINYFEIFNLECILIKSTYMRIQNRIVTFYLKLTTEISNSVV